MSSHNLVIIESPGHHLPQLQLGPLREFFLGVSARRLVKNRYLEAIKKEGNAVAAMKSSPLTGTHFQTILASWTLRAPNCQLETDMISDAPMINVVSVRTQTPSSFKNNGINRPIILLSIILDQHWAPRLVFWNNHKLYQPLSVESLQLVNSQTFSITILLWNNWKWLK